MAALRRRLWQVANRFGGPGLRAWSQNDQYRRDRWAEQGRDRRPGVVELVEKLAAGGRVVEHACGQGHLAALVDPACYSSYLGLDISAVAVAAARRQEVGDRCHFEVRDLLSWPGDAGLSLIVAEECLYYLRPAQLGRFLDRCRASLAPDGAVLATFHDRDLYPATVTACGERFPRHESITEGRSLFLVLRP